MSKQRIQVYADEETKRRIEVAALKRRMAVTDYCLAAIQQQLGEDAVLEESHVDMPITPAKDSALLAELRALQDQITVRRAGETIDVVSVLEKVREERSDELLGLR